MRDKETDGPQRQAMRKTRMRDGDLERGRRWGMGRNGRQGFRRGGEVR